jgi:hypothetical protein
MNSHGLVFGYGCLYNIAGIRQPACFWVLASTILCAAWTGDRACLVCAPPSPGSGSLSLWWWGVVGGGGWWRWLGGWWVVVVAVVARCVLRPSPLPGLTVFGIPLGRAPGARNTHATSSRNALPPFLSSHAPVCRAQRQSIASRSWAPLLAMTPRARLAALPSFLFPCRRPSDFGCSS